MFSVYLWLKFLHVLAVCTFVLSHGASIVFSFRLKREKELPRIQAMMDLSGALWPAMMLSLLVILIAGIILGVMGKWWLGGWFWVSIVISLGVTVWMFVIGQGTYHPMRKAFGLPYMHKSKEMPPEEPVSEAERFAMIEKTRPWQMFWIAFGGFVIVLWLMMFKPF